MHRKSIILYLAAAVLAVSINACQYLQPAPVPTVLLSSLPSPSMTPPLLQAVKAPVLTGTPTLVLTPTATPAAITTQLAMQPALVDATRSAGAGPTPSATATATATRTPSPVPQPPIRPVAFAETENILVLGIDHRVTDPDPSWRTDTIMVMAVDHAQNRVGIVNIPRDLFVPIPGRGWDRINQADYFGESSGYPGGGPALLRRVVSETLGINVGPWVRIQMEGLVRLVDTLGGVDVTLACPLHERAPAGVADNSPNGLLDFDLPAGAVHLDGAAAKKFATWRYVSTDFGRARRQQQLIWAMRERALQLDVVPKIPALWGALADTFSTNLTAVDVARLAGLGMRIEPKDVHGVVLSMDALEYYWTDQGAVVLAITDNATITRELNRLFEGPPLTQQLAAPAGEDGSACPPAPTPVPTFTPTPGPAPAKATDAKEAVRVPDLSPTPSPSPTPDGGAGG